MNAARRLVFVIGLVTIWAVGAQAQERVAYFDAPVVVADESHRIDALLDFDGDGFEDAVGHWLRDSSTDFVTAWRNDGTGRLVPAWTRWFPPSASNPLHLVVGDLDRDGADDLVICVGSTVKVYKWNDANGFFEIVGHLIEPFDDAVIGDFDGNGWADLVTCSAAQRTVKFYRARYSFSYDTYTSTSPHAFSHLSVADVDQDGVSDIVAWGDGITILQSYWNGLSFGRHFLVGGGMLATGDVDGDRDDDIVVFGASSYVLIRQTAPGTFAVEPEHEGGGATKLADVDGDGDLDGICCGGGGPPSPRANHDPSVFEIALNDGTGTFAPVFRIPSIGSERIAGAADLDHDGDVDLVGGRCVYYARGPIVDPYPRFGSVAPARMPVDFDGDGDPDWSFSVGGVIANRGDGSGVPTSLVLPAAPAGATFRGPGIAGDFDGDGDVDLIAITVVDRRSVALRWLWNVGGRTFVDGGDASTDPLLLPAYETVVGDVDGDGLLDVCTLMGGGSGGGGTFLQDGAGGFVAGPFFPGESVRAIRDLDGDSTPDLLTSDGNSHLRVHLALGGGVFGAATPLGTAVIFQYDDTTHDVVDMDGDGDLDVVALSGTQVQIFLNDGAGAFPDVVPLDVGINLVRAQAIDVDGDGRLDVVASSPPDCPQGSLVFRARGALEFDPPVTQVFAASSVCDADGDGDLDVLSAMRSLGGAPFDVAADHVVKCRAFDSRSGGSRVQFGDALAGSGGIEPVLGAVGPFRVGLPHEVRVGGALGSARSFLATGRSRAAVAWRGGVVHVGAAIDVRQIPMDGPTGVAGAGHCVLRREVTPPRYRGRTFVMQAIVRDSGAIGGYALSNGLELRFGE